MAELSKTPEEIKKGLECRILGSAEKCDHKCSTCQLFVPGYLYPEIYKDTLALIQQLERDKAWASENYDLIREENKRLEAQVPKWISVEERLPEASGKYIVCTEKRSVYCTKFKAYGRGGSFQTDINTHITHWMPMPEPPKEGSNA